jgi:uncharacterized membrane protein
LDIALSAGSFGYSGGGPSGGGFGQSFGPRPSGDGYGPIIRAALKTFLFVVCFLVTSTYITTVLVEVALYSCFTNQAM